MTSSLAIHVHYNNSLCPFIVHATSSNYKCLPPNQNMTADLYQSFHFPNAEDNVGRASSRLAESIAHPKSSSQRLMLAIPFPCPLLLSFHNIILPRSASVEVRVALELHVRSAEGSMLPPLRNRCCSIGRSCKRQSCQVTPTSMVHRVATKWQVAGRNRSR